MTRRQYIVRGSIAGGAIVLAWLLFFALPRWTSPNPTHAPSAAAATPEGSRRINASLFYVAEDGLRLVAVSREVPYQPDPTEQARALIQAQLEPIAPPFFSAVPAGTTLRTLFITEGRSVRGSQPRGGRRRIPADRSTKFSRSMRW